MMEKPLNEERVRPEKREAQCGGCGAVVPVGEGVVSLGISLCIPCAQESGVLKRETEPMFWLCLGFLVIGAILDWFPQGLAPEGPSGVGMRLLFSLSGLLLLGSRKAPDKAIMGIAPLLLLGGVGLHVVSVWLVHPIKGVPIHPTWGLGFAVAGFLLLARIRAKGT